MINNDEIYNFPQTNNVTFEPGARSAWHSHGGMILLVTGGVGYYQEEGKPAQIIRKGDVVECAPGVKHWHGAAPDSWFSQMVVYDPHYTPEEGAELAEEPVTDEQYENLETEEYAGRTVTEDNRFMFQRGEGPVTLDTFNGSVYLSDLIGGDNVALANLIQERTGGELFEIETVQEYLGEHEPLIDQEQRSRVRIHGRNWQPILKTWMTMM